MSLSVNIKKKFGEFCLQVEFEQEGGVLGILGASGCGKSVTLKCIAGIEKPDDGRIVLNGITLFDSEKKINLPPQERRIGYLFQNYALFPNMTVSQNILCGLCRESNREEKQKKLENILRVMQLEGLEKHRPGQLSGGQQQRVALARILVGEPEMIMLDEPFSALDSYLKDSLQTHMKDLLREFGKDVLLVTHSRDEAYHLCQKIAVMGDGQILNLNDTKRLFADPRSRTAAVLTGCKNTVPARKTGEYEVEVPQWGIRLTTAHPVEDHLWGIGIRAHYFHGNTTQNQYPVRFLEEVEEPFETILLFQYQHQQEQSPPIWWRIPKDRKPGKLPETLGISPQNVLLLYQ